MKNILDTGQNDEILLKESLSNSGAFELLVNRYQRLFLRKAMEIVGNRDDALDVVQETFVRIYGGAPRFETRPGASFKSWAYTILLKQCYTLYKKRKRHMSHVLTLDPELEDVIVDEQELEAREKKFTLESIYVLISRLPVKLRRIAKLYFVHGKKDVDIARGEGISAGAVRVRIHRAKSELRRLGEETNLIQSF